MKKVFTMFALFVCVAFSQAQVTFWGVDNASTKQNAATQGKGFIFNIQSDGTGYTTDYQFGTTASDGYQQFYYLQYNLLQAGNGIFYGKTSQGGTLGGGVIYSFNPSTNAYTILHNNSGVGNYGSLMLGIDGKMYGLLGIFAGANTDGEIFSLDTLGNFTDLYDFSTAANFTVPADTAIGHYPQGGLMQTSSGRIYGMTGTGTSTNEQGDLWYFNPATVSNSNPPTLIHAFQKGVVYTGNKDAGFPTWNTNVIQGSDGLLYGMGSLGGNNANGAAFSCDTNGNNYRVICSFNATGTPGYEPSGSLIQATNGLLYGMDDGSYGQFYSIDTNRNNPSPFTAIQSFTSASGNTANGDVYQASDGNLYGYTTGSDTAKTAGMDAGEMWEYNLTTSTFSTLYTFTKANGCNPSGAPRELRNPTTNLTGPFCQGATINIPVLAIGVYTVANVFTAQLSDNTGSFASPVNLGTLNGPRNGTITATLPALTTGSGYKIRIISSNPNWTSGTPTAAFTINPTVTPAVSIGITSGSNPSCGGSITFTATSTNGGLSPTYNFEVNSGSVQNTTSATYTTSSLTNGAVVNVIMTSNAACPSPATATSSNITMTINNCWVGGNNANDWATGSNWGSGIAPTNSCTTNVSIPVNGNNPVVNSPVNIGSITITGAGRELITLNSSLSICGNWTDNSGASSAASGSQVILNGGSAQTLSGSLTFDQLAIANTSGGVSLAAGAAVGINTSLLLETGNINTTGGTLTLNSASPTQAAIIDNFSVAASPDAGTITGNVTAQRFYAAPTTTSSYSQHEMGSPVSAPALSQFGASGTAGYVSDFNCDATKLDLTSPYGTVFGYDETHGATCGIQQWKVLTSGNAVNGVGYSIRSGGPGTLSLTGTPNITGNVTLSGTNSGWSTNYTLQGYPETPGWTLASNPYPATLKISSTSLANNVTAGFDGVGVMVWNTTGGSAGTYTLTTTIAPFQAFMVHKTSAGGSSTYTINASDRSTSTTTFYKDATPNMLNITATNQSTGLTDVTAVGYNSNAVSGFDPNFDVHKIAGDVGRHAIYSLSGSDWMYQNVNPSIEQAPTVQMGFAPGVSGTYTLNFDGVNSFDATSYITLEDTKLYTFHDVRGGDYTFTADANDSWGRFVLHFTPPASINTTNATCSEQGMINIVQPGTAIWNYTLADNNNAIVSTGVLNSNSPLSATVAAGVYTITLIDNSGYTVVKTVEVSGAQPVVASFTASANTLNVNQELTLNSTSAGAVTNSWNFGDGTTDNGATVTHSYTSEGVYNVTLNSTSASGCSSSTTNTVTVNRSVTGVTNLNDINNISIWSYENVINVDFTQLKDVQANIEIYNILGQKIAEDKYTTSAVYRKELPNIEAGYVLVTVKNNDVLITKKLFIDNTK